jgi:hypothetical protein
VVAIIVSFDVLAQFLHLARDLPFGHLPTITGRFLLAIVAPTALSLSRIRHGKRKGVRAQIDC